MLYNAAGNPIVYNYQANRFESIDSDGMPYAILDDGSYVFFKKNSRKAD
jgi:hypothetical protein